MRTDTSWSRRASVKPYQVDEASEAKSSGIVDTIVEKKTESLGSNARQGEPELWTSAPLGVCSKNQLQDVHLDKADFFFLIPEMDGTQSAQLCALYATTVQCEYITRIDQIVSKIAMPSMEF
ncbi:unnamed protein product, partial [Mesorhabditis spiculigera]